MNAALSLADTGLTPSVITIIFVGALITATTPIIFLFAVSYWLRPRSRRRKIAPQERSMPDDQLQAPKQEKAQTPFDAQLISALLRASAEINNRLAILTAIIGAAASVFQLFQHNDVLAIIFGSVSVIGIVFSKLGVFIFTFALLPALKALPAAFSGYYLKKWLDERGKKKTPSDTPPAEPEPKTASSTPPALPETKPTRVRARAKQPPDTPEAEPAPVKRTRKRASLSTTNTPKETP